MKIPLFYIDAFTSEVFKGNPAAVCLLESWLPTDVLQLIAAEHNLSETAFVVKEDKETFHLKWFTPKVEVPLCGHATLASAHVLFSIYNFGDKPIRFKTKSGILEVKHLPDGKLTLNFPAFIPEPFVNPPDIIAEALGKPYAEIYKSSQYLMAVYKNEGDIVKLTPDFAKINASGFQAIIVTAPGKECDFVSRFFAPAVGINEDPVTGSAHCGLVPFWSKRLNKKTLYARQLSERTGELWCQSAGDHVLISGRAITYMQGTIRISLSHSNKLMPFEGSK